MPHVNQKPNLRAASSRREYERRINRVIDHVQAHLDGDLTLERLAEVAAFSPFHFHRVFAAITGETLSDFIRRVRLERAAGALTLLPETSIIEDCASLRLLIGRHLRASVQGAFQHERHAMALGWRTTMARGAPAPERTRQIEAQSGSSGAQESQSIRQWHRAS